MTTMIISNEGMKCIMKIVKSLQASGLLLQGASKTTENETKEKMVNFLACY